MVQQRITWVDQLRGFCMLAILWFHTEMYYAEYDVTPYAFYVADVLAVFFFLSGYLFFNGRLVDVRHKAYGVVRWLLIPYFILTALIGLPKALLHHESFSPSTLAIQILSGHASWFIAALIVSQLLFIAALWLTKSNRLLMALLALVTLVLACFVGNSYQPSPAFYEQNLWHFNESLLGFFLLTLGYCYHAFHKSYTWHSKTAYLALLTLLFMGSKYAVYVFHPRMVFGPLIVSSFPFFVADIVVNVLFLVELFARLPRLHVLEWVGRCSIAFYFICGGVPFVVATTLNHLHLPYNGFLRLSLAYLCVAAISSAIVWLIYRFTPIFKPLH